MGIQFDWESPEDEPSVSAPRPPRHSSRWRPRWWGWLVVVLLAALTGAGLLMWWLQPDEAQIARTLQLYVETEKRAVTLGDHGLFLSLQVDEPAWIAAQYQRLSWTTPLNETVSDVEVDGDVASAWLTGSEGGQLIRRRTFFTRRGDRFVHGTMGTADSDVLPFWGAPASFAAPWGTLRLHEADAHQAEFLLAFVDDLIRATCRDGCNDQRLPLTLSIRPDGNPVQTAADVQVSSPQLVGLTSDGAPGPRFRQQLTIAVDAHLQPAQLRFAVPDDQLDTFQAQSGLFNALNPQVRVEVIGFSQLPADPVALLQSVDGAFMAPTLPLITGGHVVDLAPYAAADATFQWPDFDPLAQSGATWGGRLWMVPQHLQFRLVYADRVRFEQRPFPPAAYMQTLWDGDEQATEDAVDAVTGGSIEWGYMDGSIDTLLAYAFAERCGRTTERPCRARLDEQALQAALTWYQAVIGHGIMPDTTHMSTLERDFYTLNRLSYPREVALWVDHLALYEHNYLLGPLDVMPFPAHRPHSRETSLDVDITQGFTPFHVEGGLISAWSPAPGATWTWLVFLSQQWPLGPARSLPARTSVASANHYWSNLPTEVQMPVRQSYVQGRAVTIPEQTLFVWPALAALSAQELSPQDAAQQMLQISWFAH